MNATQLLTFFTALALGVPASAPLAASPVDSTRNRMILAALEPFEALTETALTGNAARVAKAHETAQGRRAGARALLSDTTVARFDDVFRQLEAAHARRDYIEESLQAAELYELMVSSLDAAALTIPTKEVNLLDYCGFRLTALSQAPSPRWIAVAATTRKAGEYWAAIRSRVSDTTLRRQMDEAQNGLATASERQDISLTRANARKVLALVDDLERYFARQ